ncbi:MAG: hypothetical protein JG769_815 [Oscillospiraceae bacterium]|jgi:CRISPR-associated protein (TIGR03984 family)|nr:hypothetical protein [Oscillospiraceae bacterium]
MNEFKNIFSQIQPYDFKGIEKLLDDIKGYKYVVIYNINEVLIEFAEKISAKKLEKFTELRAFNNDGELAVRSYGGKYKGRIRTDGIGGNTEYIDEAHLLWGDKNKNKIISNEYTSLSEDRGMQLLVPFIVPVGENAFIKIRNYLSSDLDIFQFDDWRMVEFFSKKVEMEED